MLIPVRINSKLIPLGFRKFIPNAPNPLQLLQREITFESFSDCMSVFKFGNVYKSTNKSRYILTAKLLKKYIFEENPNILEIGASDGSASKEFIENLDFKNYYITDLNIVVNYKKTLLGILFYDENDNLLLYANALFVIYPVSIFAFLKSMFKGGNLNPNSQIKLINPYIQNLKRHVSVLKYNMFEHWNQEFVDVIILANILNLTYFSSNEIVIAIKNLKQFCNENALIVIIENRQNEPEKSSVFKLKGNSFELFDRINSGSEIESLILNI